ncbi:hypothetical protein [Vibrio vulnificus]|uniref:Uncharacterized protein n=1 Tax=Vibrio vulnificus TaxID=672 RepID=A0A2S3R220_VIBVL|nr:hypothetical protein [Vibrio vulnificus]POB47159.1 hypothetical protein CRN52_13855 [Vibrio vulnificus]
MAAIKLHDCRNQARYIKRLSQLFAIASKRVILPSDDYAISVPDRFDLKDVTRKDGWHGNSISLHLSRHVPLSDPEQYHAELRLFENGESSNSEKRAQGMLFLRYGVRYNFESRDLMASIQERFSYERSLSAVLRNLVNLMNEQITAHQKELSAKETPVQLYNIVEEVEGEDDIVLEKGLTLSEAESKLCWHLNHDADAYIQDEN